MGGGGNSIGLPSIHSVAKPSSFRKSTGIPVKMKPHVIGLAQDRIRHPVVSRILCKIGYHLSPTNNGIALDREKVEASQSVQFFGDKRADLSLV